MTNERAALCPICGKSPNVTAIGDMIVISCVGGWFSRHEHFGGGCHHEARKAVGEWNAEVEKRRAALDQLAVARDAVRGSK